MRPKKETAQKEILLANRSRSQWIVLIKFHDVNQTFSFLNASFWQPETRWNVSFPSTTNYIFLYIHLKEVHSIPHIDWEGFHHAKFKRIQEFDYHTEKYKYKHIYFKDLSMTNVWDNPAGKYKSV